MRLHVATVAVVLLAAVLVSGCFTPSTIAVLQGPANYAKSPSFDAKASWRTAVLPPSSPLSVYRSPVSGLYDYAGMALMRTGRFTVVDRAEVDALLDEQEFSYSGAVDASTAARLGKMLGAEAVLIVNVTSIKHDDFWGDEPDQRDAELHVKLISVETTELLYSAKGQGSDFEGASGALEMALETALAPLRGQ